MSALCVLVAGGGVAAVEAIAAEPARPGGGPAPGRVPSRVPADAQQHRADWLAAVRWRACPR